jgi:hypothetical protein
MDQAEEHRQHRSLLDELDGPGHVEARLPVRDVQSRRRQDRDDPHGQWIEHTPSNRYWQYDWYVWNNDGDRATLKRPTGTVVDAFVNDSRESAAEGGTR